MVVRGASGGVDTVLSLEILTVVLAELLLKATGVNLAGVDGAKVGKSDDGISEGRAVDAGLRSVSFVDCATLGTTVP